MSQNDVKLSHGMRVIHDGSRDAPPLLLIHGSGSASGFWNPMIPELADHYHVVRVDLPGCGQSPPTKSYDVPVQARRIAALLDDLDVSSAAVAGYSSGGYIATAIAEQRPELVRSLALISSGPSMDALLRQPLILRVLLAPPFGPLIWPLRSDAMMRNGITSVCARPVDIPDSLIGEVKPTGYGTFRKILDRNGAYISARTMPDRLTALDVPIMVIFGDSDRRWDPLSVHQYDRVPNARIEILPDVGHIPLIEAPDVTIKLLLDFAAAGR